MKKLVILLKLDDVPLCRSFEVEVDSPLHWDNIVIFFLRILRIEHSDDAKPVVVFLKAQILCSMPEIEDSLLQQIQLISVGQAFPIHIALADPVRVTVVRIETLSSEDQTMAYINADTKVLVKPFIRELDQGKDEPREQLPTSVTRVFGELCTDATDTSFSARIRHYCGDEGTSFTARILPDVLHGDFHEHSSIPLVYSVKNCQSSSPSFTIVSLKDYETKKSTYALSVDIPSGSMHLKAVADSLKRYAVRHCLFSSSLREVFGNSYKWIEISPLSKDCVRQVDTLEVFSKVAALTYFFKFSLLALN
ncbi:unnamed protein product [Gongylonema pulchrum]|uniref:PEX-1N domain-containing protein n=1 Tax=Gongylonema pulchrum TaxID=637853 RepID=A0A183DU85_9BILA|nr:unnamed protein product [Gongylonema pulchrum]